MEYFKYIISWIAHPFRTLTKTGKCLTLIGEQGIGKTMIFEFIRDFVTGDLLTTHVDSIDNITCRFNSILASKLFVCINKTTSVECNQGYKAQFTKLKELITGSTINVERKGIDINTENNFVNYSVCSNNEHAVDVEIEDRRYPIFKCNNKYKNNIKYFQTLGKSFTEEVENAFYTFVRSTDIEEFLVDLNIIPLTQARQNVMHASRPKTSLFFDELLIDGTECIPSSYIHYKADFSYLFIFSEDIYNIYKN